MNSSLIRKVAVLAAGMVPFAAWSLGLGEIQVSSRLNQPLAAEIELLYDDVAEPESTEVSLAAPEDFERVGLDASALDVDLMFEISTGARGRYVISVTSTEPVTDPFVDFLIEVNWPNGRLLREYVVLLDPPVSASSARVSSAAPQPAQPSPQPTVQTTTPPPRTEPAPSMSGTSSAGSSSFPSSRASGGDYEVASGDTLWEIARDNRASSDVTINQMMMALYRMNPDAFYQDNINALKKGAILRMPGAGDLNSQSVAEALASVRTQNQAWESYRQSSSSRTPVVSESTSTADYVSPSRPPAGDSDTRLELVPPTGSSDDLSDSGSGQSGSDAANRAQLAGLRDDLARSREDLISTNQENEEMRSRIADLENLISTYERTITLKDADLADLQNQIELTGQAVADLETIPADVMADAGNAADTMADSISGNLGFDDTDGASLDQELAALDQDTSTEPVDVDPEPAETEPTPVAETTPPARSEPSMVDKALGLVKNPYVLGGAGLLLLLGVGGLVAARRGSNDDDLGGSSLIDRIAADAEEATTSELPVVGETDLTNNLGADTEPPALDDLKAAAAAEPESAQAHLAYLRALYAGEDKAAFTDAAKAMLAGVGGTTHPAWMEVKAMGANLAPENELFGDALAEADADLDMPSVDPSDEADVSFDVVDNSASDGDDDLNFDLDGADDDLSLDLDAPTEPAADVDLGLDLDGDSDISLDSPGDDLSLDFDLDGVGDDDDDVLSTGKGDEDTEFELQSVTEGQAAADLASNLGDSLEDDATVALSADLDDLVGDSTEVDLDLGLDDADTAASDTLAELESADDDLGDLGLEDLDLDNDEMFGDDDAVGTKLDLAKAYIDMGDPEGAKGMLEEVLAEGSDGQKEEAQTLLNDLSS